MRAEWERVQKMIAQLPLEDLPEYAQNWIYMIERTRPTDLSYFIRRGDFPYFDAWAHRMHILDEELKTLGYALPARTPIIYAGYLLVGLAKTAERCFPAAGGPKHIGSAYASAPQETSAPEAEGDEDEPPREPAPPPPATPTEPC